MVVGEEKEEKNCMDFLVRFKLGFMILDYWDCSIV